MNDLVKFLISILVMYAVSLLIYFGLKKYVLNKFKLKRKHIIISMIVLFFTQIAIMSVISSSIIQYVFTIVFVVMMLILMDIIRRERDLKNRPVVGRPKAKPTRVLKKDSDK